MSMPVIALSAAVAMSLAGVWQPGPEASTAAQGGGASGLPIAAKPPEPIGTLRGSRVAVAIKPGERPTLILLAPKLSKEELATFAADAPNVRVIDGLTRETAIAHAGEAHGVHAGVLSPELLAKAPKLAWVHVPSAGVEWLLEGPMGPALKARHEIVLTNSRAVHGPAIADHAMGMLLSFSRNLRAYDAAQRERTWAREPVAGGGSTSRPFALQGRTMLIVGLGGIGTEIATRAHGFGMKVEAIRRTDAPAPTGAEYIAKIGKPADLLAMLPSADVVAICVPMTAETAGMFGAEQFAAMKPGSVLINVARGKVIKTDALLDALRSGPLSKGGGACLDVTDPEPLPPDHALWTLPNVIITPHVSADADLTRQRGRELLAENVRRFGRGEPLMNVVDAAAGY